MKINKLTMILIIIIILLISFILYDKVIPNNKKSNTTEEENITLKEVINLEYVNIYLLSNGDSYLIPINDEKIDKLNVNDNLKDRLKTLYTRAFYYDIYINNYKIKGFKINLDDKVTNLEKIEINDYIYVIFIKDNNTIGLFDYLDYYDLLNIKVIDNYDDLKNVLNIENNKIIFLNGSSKEFVIEK